MALFLKPQIFLQLFSIQQDDLLGTIRSEEGASLIPHKKNAAD